MAYDINGVEPREFPYDIEQDVKPVYRELPGWKTDLTKSKTPADFPKEFKDYIKFIEQQLGVPVTIVSVGPDRTQTIEL